MECVTTTTTSMLVNGSPTYEFVLKRGLRQGDPLSPFLFLIAVKGLNIMLSSTIEVGLFSNYKMGREEVVSISHLQFIDDTLILCEKN